MSEQQGFDIIRHPRARRVKLSVHPVTGKARLVLPPRMALKPALAWAHGQQAWLERQRATLPEARPFVDGAEIPFDDTLLTIRWDGEQKKKTERLGCQILSGGPAETMPNRVQTWLKREALRLLSEDTAACAARAGVTVTRVGIGDPRARWGSCAASGAIRYSWRLALAPRAVRLATVAHEVAHRVHMHHGPDFHALVARLYGRDPTPERRWLKANGAALHCYGWSAGEVREGGAAG